MLDLDNFKQLNDTLGHDAGDELLRLIGPRLRHAMSGQDTLARLGGDEFAILLEPGATRQATGDAAQAVLASFSEPFRVHGLVLRLTASVGIATYPSDAATPSSCSSAPTSPCTTPSDHGVDGSTTRPSATRIRASAWR